MEKNNNILEKYIHGSINEEEYKELQQKIQDDSDRSIPNMLDECWQKDMNIHVMPPSAKERTRRRIDEEIKKDLRRMWLKRVSTVAASLLIPILIFSTVYLYHEMDHYKQIPNIVSVNRGQRAGITLPDGTIVHLNSESKLTYTPEFNGKLREVSLEGEAFFEVTPNKEKPFIVKTSVFDVEVLGTSFNVSAYREDVEKSVVLVTGKVEVTASNGESVRILPNDRFRQSTDKYVVDKVNVEDYVSWKEGRLSFKNTELGGILKQLSRYYNVRIDYDKQQQITCSGKLNLDDTIEQILNTITETAPVVISKENNVYKVTIKKK